MLNTIYMILNLGTIIMAFIYLGVILTQTFRNKWSTVKTIKVQTVFTLTLCISYILQVILDIILKDFNASLVADAICATLLGFDTVYGVFCLKKAQSTHNIEFHIIFHSYCDESKIVEVDGYEVIKTDAEPKEIADLESNT